MSTQITDDITFENALENLEKLVETVEQGDVPLTKLVEKFEEGSKLLGYCQNKLGKAEQRIEQLKQSEGETILAPFNPETNESDKDTH